MNITSRLRQTLEVCDVHRKRLFFTASAIIVTAITIIAVTIIKVIYGGRGAENRCYNEP